MMNKLRSALRATFFVSLTLAFSALAQAQAIRTWVSGVGDDVNPCSRTAPCKTFAGAISKTTVGGEIDALDPSGFGTVTITKSITIDGTGTTAGILASRANGITINITAAADAAKTVRLRGLSITGAGTGVNGINVIAARKVSIEDLLIDGFSANGINVEAGSGAGVFISNTTVSNNAGVGVNVAAGGGAVAITDVNVIYNGTGLAGAITQFNNIVLFGNAAGAPASPVTPKK